MVKIDTRALGAVTRVSSAILADFAELQMIHAQAQAAKFLDGPRNTAANIAADLRCDYMRSVIPEVFRVLGREAPTNPFKI